MNTTDSQLTFQICSYLLNYPDQALIDSIPEVLEEIDSLQSSDTKQELQSYCEKVKKQSLTKLVSTYINTFDFGKKTNLYLTYMSNGEQRERGMELLFLKNFYKLHGFEVTDKELPDYLPIMLEFAGQVDEAAMKLIFERYLTNIEEVSKNLNDGNNLYGHIIKAILLELGKAGVTNTRQRSEAL
ncbi:respiratory nitrate reductase chaperone NarJ [Schinkia azotoformans MEV2011]|uniref:Respiratory nitrate reductase chaperone NarJ n=1 Tax=Schinkia azotoformans MEV2011 TaxID=1348973 RepID=A0A072NE73_SCHAZ|nr:nitrate reductase molybdenum cofactor assembly chaperone [Schinkia azotoformans]KEF35969.1 respiratory nitrate reductase chaperone NarJ [Schinkia azotoformans MEV2011]MEC1694532.1 nitrate reductase molybdenum cofactor assembly chaperone [Schinkia azotoformans]MEC1716534.1 nitrate reductase molybdenum cofactor assembly chaperone [Schinkia azotoformans]MEC1725246.1 nitrate reductase molybdenum cofactor assembly chaperone [Schinkia azotoformans]MEC1739372.1 nitrate reductase molybdenum cofacto